MLGSLCTQLLHTVGGGAIILLLDDKIIFIILSLYTRGSIIYYKSIVYCASFGTQLLFYLNKNPTLPDLHCKCRPKLISL